jgi:hypothetical protein
MIVLAEYPELLVPVELNHHTRLHGKINGETFNLDGTGYGKPYEGFLDTNLKSTNGNVHFPMTVLSPIALMGYPTYSTYQSGATDLFKKSDGYFYRRGFKFNNGGTMESEHRIVRINGHLEGDFEVIDAKIDLTGVTELEPNCIETFYPGGKGRITSFFKMRWLKEDGGYLTADVESEYLLQHQLELPCTHFRMIKFMTDHQQNNLKQAEILSVFYDIEKMNQLMINEYEK